jgi:hypothetical protein
MFLIGGGWYRDGWKMIEGWFADELGDGWKIVEGW